MPDRSTQDYYVSLEAGTDVEFTRATVRDKHEILYDEPAFIEHGAGEDKYAGPVDNMVASLGACQVSVLKQCLEKARVHEFHIEADVSADQVDRDEIPDAMPSNTAQRVRHITVTMTVIVPEEYASRAERCIEVYDYGCVVGQSFTAGIGYTPHVSLEVSA